MIREKFFPVIMFSNSAASGVAFKTAPNAPPVAVIKMLGPACVRAC